MSLTEKVWNVNVSNLMCFVCAVTLPALISWLAMPFSSVRNLDRKGNRCYLLHSIFIEISCKKKQSWKHKPESVSVNWFSSSSSCSAVISKWLWGTAGRELSRLFPARLKSPEGRRGRAGTSGKPEMESGFGSSSKDFSSSSSSSMSSSMKTWQT